MKRFAFLLLLIPSLALASTPKAKIVGPSNPVAGGAIFLSAQSSVSDGPLIWKSVGDDVYPNIVGDSQGRVGVFSVIPNAEAGKTYTIALVASGTPDPKTPQVVPIDVDVYQITVPSATPMPVVPPTPVPPTPPTPPVATLKGPVHVWVVLDHDTIPPTVGSLAASGALQADVTAAGFNYHATDINGTDIALYGLGKYITKGIPAQIYIADQNNKHFVTAVPFSTEADMKSILAKYNAN